MCIRDRDIAIAVKSGGPSPESNSKLRAIIQNARQDNMPKENIERAIKKATSKDEADLKEMVYEGLSLIHISAIVWDVVDSPAWA